jgi:hypothetical protein
MFACAITLANLAISALNWASNAAGELPTGS